MSAFSEAQKLYDPKELGKIIATCAANGVVYSDPDLFLCAYPVFSDDIETQSKLELDKTDTWFIFIASGDIARCFNVLPEKEYIAFERYESGNIKLFGFDRIRRLLNVRR